MFEAEEYTEEWTEEKESIIGNILFAVNYSLTGGSGDSFYHPNFKEDVRLISTMFPEIEFTAGWTNPEDEEDKTEFTILNGEVIGNQEITKAKELKKMFYKKAQAEFDRLTEEFEEINRINPSCEEWATLQDAITVYFSILHGLR